MLNHIHAPILQLLLLGLPLPRHIRDIVVVIVLRPPSGTVACGVQIDRSGCVRQVRSVAGDRRPLGGSTASSVELQDAALRSDRGRARVARPSGLVLARHLSLSIMIRPDLPGSHPASYPLSQRASCPWHRGCWRAGPSRPREARGPSAGPRRRVQTSAAEHWQGQPAREVRTWVATDR